MNDPRRCKGRRDSGVACGKRALPGSDFCADHRSRTSSSVLGPAIGGALVGNFIFPGGGGAVFGGLLGVWIATRSPSGGGPAESDREREHG